MNRAEPERLVLSIRLPRELKTWLEAAAERDDRSQSAEVIHMLRACMNNEPKRAAS